MEHLTTTPFGRRPVTAALLEQVREARRPASLPEFDKWELFRELCAARAAFGISDRDLTVLNALISFHPGTILSETAPLIVFPSNAALSERAHGMAESTLRRHLAALVAAGLIARHDSPNGKRYAARGPNGTIARAFGFDLRPLLVQARRITHAAAEARAAADRMRRLREDVTLMKRDAIKLAEYAQQAGLQGNWDALNLRLHDIQRAMRRKLAFAELEILRDTLARLRDDLTALLTETDEMGGNDRENERHYQNSDTNILEFESCRETAKARTPEQGSSPPALPLALVLKACPDILDYAPTAPRHWQELVALAGFVRGMMGISPDAWTEAQRDMGPEVAAITLAAILQRVSDIQSPGGYLRALSRKAADGSFSPGPMVMALLRPKAA
ncbi:replication initiation protein RepC [Rhodovulum tesquicola]|uniref:plasmid replication protein RepC n=1 Tax=Rhodovulum tesquicola TaxID=540254 RepID=UPI00209764BF|nr:plasmid replication protein RepC [Rhodovulum tesquicola]MCO8146373.1 replication initiation protein RepC [Rhodovulum tesquicola]